SPSRKIASDVAMVLSAPIAEASFPCLRAWMRFGIAIAAMMAMIAITIMSSIRVNPLFRFMKSRAPSLESEKSQPSPLQTQDPCRDVRPTEVLNRLVPLISAWTDLALLGDDLCHRIAPGRHSTPL